MTKDISIHIEYLLFRHECVILPGVGAFMASEVSASIESGAGVIVPPYRELTFNSSIKVDDGLLSHSVARKERVDHTTARLAVEDYADWVREEMSETGEVTIGSLGTLRQGEEGELTFLPALGASDFCKLTGCHRLGWSVISRPASDGGAGVPSDSHETDCDAPVLDSYAESDRYYHLAVPKRWLKIAAAAVAFIATVCLALMLPRHDMPSGTHYASVIPLNNQADSAPAEKVSRQPVPEVTVAEEKEEEDPVISTKSGSEGRYQLVVGTFATRAGAETFIESQDAVLPLYICESASGLCRVSASGSDDREELISRMNSNDFRSRFPESWVWKQ